MTGCREVLCFGLGFVFFYVIAAGRKMSLVCVCSSGPMV